MKNATNPKADTRAAKSFTQVVHEYVMSIPAGEYMTYGQVAKALGRPGAARAVGTALSKNWDPAVPCHRVIRSTGALGGYNRGLARKMELLLKEGVSRDVIKA